MKTQYRLLSAVFLLSVLCLSSCEKAPDFQKPLIKEEKANIQVNTGFVDKEVPMTSDTWEVVHVRNINPTKYLLDSRLQIMRLGGVGRVENSTGIIALEKKGNDPRKLFISMTENFSAEPRRLLIGIKDQESTKEIEIIQERGGNYELVDKIITENPTARKVTVLRLNSTTVDNKASNAMTIKTPIKEYYKTASFVSEFSANLFSVFDWTPAPDSLISMIPLEHEGVKYWDAKVKYVRGAQSSPYMANATQPVDIIVPANSKKTVYAEVTMVSRECEFTFKIKNKDTGYLSTLKGRWKQQVPIKGEIKVL